MNRSVLKKYAPQARLDFIEAVTLRARRLGLDPKLPVSVEQTGDVLLVGGQPFPASVAKRRSELACRIQQQGFDTVVEAMAYTWFNRLVAIRYMELKGYLSHGYRVLSHPEGLQPEVLEHAQHLDLTGLDKEEIIRLKTAGNQDEELYREILLAQCHELHRNMPFLFEALDDATELLLPDHLLRTDSLIAHLVSDIEEVDWQEVEVIGWLYQFYISDKKDEVIGKVVKSEDIPAATQLFTPNWIVQYLVQNSLGRLWLMANPGSNLKEKMPYYVEPAEQTPEVQAQLDSLIKVRMDEGGGTLDPESLTVIDPACGSGHILVEAYNLLRAIYEERGYRLREIPRLILQKNLYGLDIDDRAAQLAGFALLMKAREDDRRLFEEHGNPPHLNVMAIQQSFGLPDEEISNAIFNAAIQIEGGEAFSSGQLFGGGQLETLHSSGITVHDLRELIQMFTQGKTFGSLAVVPDALRAKLGKIIDLLTIVCSKGDDLSRSYGKQILEHFAWPASLLSRQYDAVVANPPYMGGMAMNLVLKDFAKKEYPESKFDIFSMFIERGFIFCKSSGFNSMVTMQSWMFLSSYQVMREKLIADKTIVTMAHLGARAFSEISGEVVQTTAFVMLGGQAKGFKPVFLKLTDGDEAKKKSDFSSPEIRFDQLRQEEFNKIPGSPIAYWASDKVIDVYGSFGRVGLYSDTCAGLTTGDNGLFMRLWYELDVESIGFSATSKDDTYQEEFKWFPCNSGGGFRKWYGNNEWVVKWQNDGYEIRNFSDANGRLKASPRSSHRYFQEGVCWNKIGAGKFAGRYFPAGFVFDDTAQSAFPLDGVSSRFLVGLFCSSVARHFLSYTCQTVSFNKGDVSNIPLNSVVPGVEDVAQAAIDISKLDWDSCELSWEFQSLPLVSVGGGSLFDSWSAVEKVSIARAHKMMELEAENNRLFIEAYGLQNELVPGVQEGQVTLSRADREKDIQRLISYAVGNMMGRFSLDEPGLIYAHSEGSKFEHSRYTKFPADADGIIPVTEDPWFEDDAAERVREFVKIVWGSETLVENMEWLADSLNRKVGESADEAIRRYLSTSFYKDHLQAYKKRPIYWLFSSGKQKAFECLVYMHRYNEGTLSRMRMEYVVPLQSRMQARIDKLTDDIDSAASSAQQKSLQKRRDKLTKQLEELRRFDENLRPQADKRIAIDLDYGVKVNYGRFGNLLAEVKAITGGKEE